MSRHAGLVIPLFSIRTSSQWGVGEIPDLVPMARWARRAGFSVLQMLPVNEAAHGQSSPYFARTAFAVDPAYLGLAQIEDFQRAGGLNALSKESRAALDPLSHCHEIDWNLVRKTKQAALEIAYRAFVDNEWNHHSERARELAHWSEQHAHWLDDYALFSAIGESFLEGGGYGGWDAWPAALRDRDPAALGEARARHAPRLLYYRYVQWQLDRQWREARWLAQEAGVSLMGDLPFMVAGDSADVWQRAREFRLDATIGAPPDAFSEEGQDWGLPVFRWDLMKQGDYEWMQARARRAAELFALYRIDHVVGLFRTWYILADKKTKGFTPADPPSQRAQGERLLEILKGAAGGDIENPLIAEDLGVVPEFVRQAMTRIGVPGYRVIRWETEDNLYKDPAKYPALSVATTGTHDTESLAEWYDTLPPYWRQALLEIPGFALHGQSPPARFDDSLRDAFLDLTYRSASDLILIPLQDAFGHKERVNVPGTLNEHNWSYRMPWTVEELEQLAGDTARLAELAARGGRT